MPANARLYTRQFIDPDGLPYAGAKVYTYSAGTTTNKNTWSDAGKTTLSANPVIADSRGNIRFYGQGNYRLVVTDSNDVTLYDFDDVWIEAAPNHLIRTSDYDTWAEAINEAVGKTLCINNSITLPSGALTIPATILGIYPLAPGVLNKDSATSLTINASVVGNPMHQWLSGFAAGEVTFGVGAVDAVLVDWFGTNTTSTKVAFAAFPIVQFGEGFYELDDEITSTTVKKVFGAGNFKTFIYQTATNKSNFVFGGDAAMEGIELRDMFLGSKATGGGTALLKLLRVNRSNFDFFCYGGYTHLSQAGCLMNTYRIVTGVNLGEPPGGWPSGWTFSATEYSVYGIVHAVGGACSSSTFIEPTIEGVKRGFYQNEGSFNILGGSIEGNSIYAMQLVGLSGQGNIIGTHFELNGPSTPYQEDILIDNLVANTPVFIEGSRLTGLKINTSSGKVVLISTHCAYTQVDSLSSVRVFNIASPSTIATSDPMSRVSRFDNTIYLRNDTLTHGMTTLGPTDCIGNLSEATPAAGGLMIRGFTIGGIQGIPLLLEGIADHATPSEPIIQITAGKKSGTDRQALAAAEKLLLINNLSTLVFQILGNGQIKLALPPIYANNAAAIAGGLASGDIYRTNSDPDTLCIVH